MTDAEDAIIEILEAAGRPMYGLEIVKASNGRLHRGTVYVHLQRLEDAGLVLSAEEAEHEVQPHIGIARRKYWLGGRRVDPSGWAVPTLA